MKHPPVPTGTGTGTTLATRLGLVSELVLTLVRTGLARPTTWRNGS